MDDNTSITIVAVGMFTTFAVMWIFGGPPANDDLQARQDRYCEMVDIFIESDGEFGWPDYEESYGESCNA